MKKHTKYLIILLFSSLMIIIINQINISKYNFYHTNKNIYLNIDNNKIELFNNKQPILFGWIQSNKFKKSIIKSNCFLIKIGSLENIQISIPSGGWWYGGPQVSRGFWPINFNRIERQNFTSDDIIQSRESIGSILESIWFTSTGATIRIFSNTIFEFSFNVPCNNEFQRSIGKLCIWTHKNANLILQMCVNNNLRRAQKDILSDLPKPKKKPSFDIIKAPIWSTWAKYKMNITQKLIESFANEIIQNNYPYSYMEIDDKWSSEYGDITFDPIRFPKPKTMIRKLKKLGFKISLWITPFASLKSKAYIIGANKEYWIMNKDKKPIVIKWWQGDGVILNITNKKAADWMEYRLKSLMLNYKIDDFKFDAGESIFVPKNSLLNPNIYANKWVEFASKFGFISEVRAVHNSQNHALWVREFDKDSTWNIHNGLKSLITGIFNLGSLGYPYVLPDMIGGNAYNDNNSQSFIYGNIPNKELFIRWCYANALLPAMQFSITPWQYDKETNHLCKNALNIRNKYINTIIKLAKQSFYTGEPIIKPLWWYDPNDPTCQWINDQFILNNTIISPVLQSNIISRPVYLPKGLWIDNKKKIYKGPIWLHDYNINLDEIGQFHLLS